MNKKTIGFIGGGNMARSLIGGLVASGVDPSRLHVSEPGDELRLALAEDFSLHSHEDNQAVVDQADIVVFAVKPQVLKQVATAIQPRSDVLYISIAAGITTVSLDNWLGGNRAIVRAMPNTPALVQSGASGLFANPAVTDSQRDDAESILRAVGLTVWVSAEEQLDAVTALSGSGPAYFFLFIEAMEEAGEKLGLPRETARLLAIQTAFGAAKLALEVEAEPAELRRQVTSPGGTTEQAILSFNDSNLLEIVEKAMNAACERAAELSTQLG